jgi:hypothetical protein
MGKLDKDKEGMYATGSEQGLYTRVEYWQGETNKRRTNEFLLIFFFIFWRIAHAVLRPSCNSHFATQRSNKQRTGKKKIKDETNDRAQSADYYPCIYTGAEINKGFRLRK